ncbi:MAG: SpoVG family protein [Phytoplasma sp.]|uniref:SpoVG family protein n=1 Tax=Phytoplasma sp. TaxID=2155 RepID=UPI002B414F8D|nr:SpoVG family protein [Phytoplasma sp.]WRH06974.1 MAG: SpoVG family protein [Phytoplasma sp.]
MNFEITNVKINLYNSNKTRLRGKASITINNDFVVHGIKMIQGERNLFIAMPSTKNSKGVYIDIAHPIRQETRHIIETECKKVFQEMIENSEEPLMDNNKEKITEQNEDNNIVKVL